MEEEYENIYDSDTFLKEWGTTATFTHSDAGEEFILSNLIKIIAPLYKMTGAQILAIRKMIVVKTILFKEENERKIKAELRLLRNPEDVQTQLITICIDQKLEQSKAVEKQLKIMDKILSAKYKWLKGTYNFEYFGKEGWNPHIHIKIDKTTKGATIAQMLRRKLQDIPEAYRINVITRSAKEHDGYIEGEKTETKRESIEFDKIFREEYKIKDYYLIN